jgi:hypothetical protein
MKEPSLVEILSSIRVKVPEKEFEFAAQVFDMLIEKIKSVHDFFCKMRGD